MFRYLILEILLPLIVFLFLRSLLGNLFRSTRSVTRQESAPPQPTVVTGGELKKDPVCGTYVSSSLSVTRKINGEMVHFCSKECRDKYRAA